MAESTTTMAMRIRKITAGCGTLFPTFSTTSRILWIGDFGALVGSLMRAVLSRASRMAEFVARSGRRRAQGGGDVGLAPHHRVHGRYEIRRGRALEDEARGTGAEGLGQSGRLVVDAQHNHPQARMSAQQG